MNWTGFKKNLGCWSRRINIIKGLLGGDMFDGEKKFSSEHVPIKGNFCILITSNYRLHLHINGSDDMEAWRQRLLTIKFEAKPPAKQITNFSEILIQEEGSGIMNWALEGLRMAYEDIMECGDIKITERQKKRVNDLLYESESVRCFMET